MKEISLISFVKKHIEDDYVMNVLYYSVKNAFVEKDFSLYGFSYFHIDGRYLGDTIKVTSRGNYRTPVHSLALILSLRLIMLNHKYLESCEDDSLIITSKPRETFQWINYISIIMSNWDDAEVNLLFQMMENYYYDEEFSDDEKSAFKRTIVKPEYKNERVYYKKIAQRTSGVLNGIIGNNAFLEANIKNYTIPEDIVYVGDTAFAYCEDLDTLEFEGKVIFGTFPIIECTNLKSIIVPEGLKEYYEDNLPYYKDLIIKKNDSGKTNNDKEVKEETEVENDNDIEIVYVDIPSAEPYLEVDASSQEPTSKVAIHEEERMPIDEKILRSVFDKKASSYKYFWMMAIISLAKEKNHLSISFSDILIRWTAMAWPIVFEDEIDLGSGDMIKKYLEDVSKKTKLIKAASSRVVENHLKQHYSSQGVDKILAPLLKNVPYRFLSPWIKYTTDEEVVAKSCSNNFNGLYALHSNYIVLDEDWWEYIETHYAKVCDFVKESFIDYVKKYNDDMKLLKLMTAGWQLI